MMLEVSAVVFDDNLLFEHGENVKNYLKFGRMRRSLSVRAEPSVTSLRVVLCICPTTAATNNTHHQACHEVVHEARHEVALHEGSAGAPPAGE